MREGSLSGKVCLAVCLAFALAHILFWHNGFYDISRSKYALLLAGMYGAALPVAAALLRDRARGALPRPGSHAADAGAALLLLSAAVSVLLCRDRAAALSGSEGRQAGGLFLGAVCLLYAYGRLACSGVSRHAPLWLAEALTLSGSICAAIGAINFLGWDPLGFYPAALRRAYRNDFLSTIGNVNFFSAYMCLTAGLAAGLFLRLRSRKRWWALVAFGLCAAGVLASRSDGGFLGMGALAAAVIALTPDRPRGAGEALLLLAAACAAALLLRWLTLLRAEEHLALADSMAAVVLQAPLPVGLAGCVAAVGYALLRRCGGTEAARRRARAPRRCLLAALLLTALTAAGLMVWYTAIAPEAVPPAPMLRLDDSWGTYRGFIWRRTLEIWRGLPPLQKLFGVGPDMLGPILRERYAEEMAALTGIPFDSAHNELLQLLVTVGAAGLAGYLLLAFAALRSAWRGARESAAAAAVFAALCAHLAQSTVNIAQPETTPAVFLLFAIACASSFGNDRRRVPAEPVDTENVPFS